MDAARVSAELFGRPCRLPLALWILHHPKDRFFQSEPPEALGGRTAIRQELDRFVRAGLLDVERPDGDVRVFYVKRQTALWNVVTAAGQALEAE